MWKVWDNNVTQEARSWLFAPELYVIKPGGVRPSKDWTILLADLLTWSVLLVVPEGTSNDWSLFLAQVLAFCLLLAILCATIWLCCLPGRAAQRVWRQRQRRRLRQQSWLQGFVASAEWLQRQANSLLYLPVSLPLSLLNWFAGTERVHQWFVVAEAEAAHVAEAAEARKVEDERKQREGRRRDAEEARKREKARKREADRAEKARLAERRAETERARQRATAVEAEAAAAAPAAEVAAAEPAAVAAAPS